MKTDGSYVSMDFFWNWLRRSPAKGGGRDTLITFNHPGGDPHLTPFDGGLPHTQLLAQVPGGSNWNDLAYVPDVERQVAGMEVNGGDDIEWFVKALNRGWHLGPVAAEDEHQREWSTSADGKTLMLTRGRGPRDYYFAFENHRTVAIRDELVNGTPGTPAIVPKIHYFADGARAFRTRPRICSGRRSAPATTHTLNVQHGRTSRRQPESRSCRTRPGARPHRSRSARPTGPGRSRQPRSHSTRGRSGLVLRRRVPAATGTSCGTNQEYSAVTAPIWLAA